MSTALVIQHAMRVRGAILSSVVYLVLPYIFSYFNHKRHHCVSTVLVIQHEMRVRGAILSSVVYLVLPYFFFFIF